MGIPLCFEIGGYELRRRFSIDGVSDGMQRAHVCGRPISHRPKQGFRPTISWDKRSAGDSEQILLATPSPRSNLAKINAWLRSLHSLADMLGSKVDALPFDCPPRRVSTETNRPEGIIRCFQVVADEIKPSLFNRVRNLLSKDFCRLALCDEVVPGWPEVPLISKPKSFACLAERLARTGTGPNRSVIWEPGAAKGERPNSDPGEEVTLRESAQIAWMDIFDTPFIHDAWRDVAGLYQVSQPLGGVGVELVIVSGHTRLSGRRRPPVTGCSE